MLRCSFNKKIKIQKINKHKKGGIATAMASGPAKNKILIKI